MRSTTSSIPPLSPTTVDAAGTVPREREASMGEHATTTQGPTVRDVRRTTSASRTPTTVPGHGVARRSLVVGHADDPLEHEADDMAANAMSLLDRRRGLPAVRVPASQDSGRIRRLDAHSGDIVRRKVDASLSKD